MVMDSNPKLAAFSFSLSPIKFNGYDETSCARFTIYIWRFSQQTIRRAASFSVLSTSPGVFFHSRGTLKTNLFCVASAFFTGLLLTRNVHRVARLYNSWMVDARAAIISIAIIFLFLLLCNGPAVATHTIEVQTFANIPSTTIHRILFFHGK